MQNLTPVPRDQRPPLPDFAPVPRKHRHDGWTPERQKAFIGALADTGSVKTACRMVNMSQVGAYYLRRQPGAEGFRRAWEAALDFGVQLLKDEAFERAMNGQLVPVFVAGKLMGFRRKKNDRLLMFCLRHYGQDQNGRRVTVNYFSSKASAASGAAAANPPLPLAGEGRGEGVFDERRGVGLSEPRTAASAEASTTTIRTTISNPDRIACGADRDDALAATLNAFEGVPLDEEAQSEILRVLEQCAERRREAHPDNHQYLPDRLDAQEDDPECDFIRIPSGSVEYRGDLESGVGIEEFVPFVEGEGPWQALGEPVPEWFTEWEQRQASGEPAPDDGETDEEALAATRATVERQQKALSAREPVLSNAEGPDPDDPRLDWRNWESGEYVAPD